jgi:aryl-alcohol dehydrogenase-like predicted oxidoreductase
MQYHQLGTTSLHISRLAFGCMSLKKDNRDAATILQKAVELGINFFDTADLYEQGANEMLVGAALKEKRNKIFLATKVGNQGRSDGGWDWNPRYDYITREVEESLRRLQTEYIDLYQLHGGTMEDPVDETIRAFEDLVHQGKIRYYGISSIRPNVIRTWVERSNLSTVMLQYSLLDRRPEESVLPLLKEKKIGVLVRGALAQGLLVDKPARPYLDHAASFVEDVSGILEKEGTDRRKEQLAMNFVWHHPAVTSIIAGIRTLQQLEAAIAAEKSPGLNEAIYRALQSSIQSNFYLQHR